jgi:hypothetical protein
MIREDEQEQLDRIHASLDVLWRAYLDRAIGPGVELEEGSVPFSIPGVHPMPDIRDLKTAAALLFLTTVRSARDLEFAEFGHRAVVLPVIADMMISSYEDVYGRTAGVAEAAIHAGLAT